MGDYHHCANCRRFSVNHYILGVIKGSETTLTSETHFLDCDTYLNLSARTQATFASKRKEIYALFETYLKMKRDRGEYDAADRQVPRLSYQTLLIPHISTGRTRFFVVWRRMASKAKGLTSCLHSSPSMLVPKLTAFETDTLTKSRTTC